MAGFEPAAPRPPAWCATKLRYIPEDQILGRAAKSCEIFIEIFWLSGITFLAPPFTWVNSPHGGSPMALGELAPLP